MNQENPTVDLKHFIHETTWYFLSHLTKDYENIVKKAKEIIVDHKLKRESNVDYNPIIDPNLLKDEFQKCTCVICTDERGLIFSNLIKDSIAGIGSFSILMLFSSLFSLTTLSFFLFSMIAAIFSFFCTFFYRLYRESHTVRVPPEILHSFHLFINIREVLASNVNIASNITTTTINNINITENKYHMFDIVKKKNKIHLRSFDTGSIYTFPICISNKYIFMDKL